MMIIEGPARFSTKGIFHVLGRGWYVEHPGVAAVGPFPSRPAAEALLEGTDEKPVRINTDRFYFVAGTGWFVHTREGVRGGFTTKHEARIYLDQLVQRSTEHRPVVWSP